MRNTERAAGDGEERWRLGCFLVLVTLTVRGWRWTAAEEGIERTSRDIFVV